MPDGPPEPFWLSGSDLLRAYRKRTLSPTEVLDVLLARIGEHDTQLNSFTSVNPQAIHQATESAVRIAAGASRPLEGIPIAVKDLIDTAGLQTAYGSKVYGGHRPAADAVVVRQLREAGAIIIGKTATHEFAWGVTTDNPHNGPTRNPWSTDRVPGGSSGGSAVAVAAGLCPIAIGTDTAGSVRIPASICGVTALRPTHGVLSTHGAHPLAPTLDTVGTLARTAADIQMVHEVLTPPRFDYPPTARGRRARVAALPPLDGAPMTRMAQEAVDRALAILSANDQFDVVSVETALVADPYAVMSTIVLAEGLDSHRRAGTWPARAQSYGQDVRARLDLAATVTLHDYIGAQRQRLAISQSIRALFAEVDILISPVVEVPAREVTDRTSSTEAAFRTGVMRHTALQSLTGLPAIAAPVGLWAGMPLGVQLTCDRDHDFVATSAALALERAQASAHPY